MRSIKMLNAMRILLTISLFLLSGCIDKSEYGYKPQDDEFVLKYFEYYLSKTDIEYTKGADGFYYASKPDIDNIMRPLGEKASGMGLHTGSLEVVDGCGFNLLREYLDANNVVYYVYQEKNKTLIKTNSQESKDFNIIGHYAKFENDCQERI